MRLKPGTRASRGAYNIKILIRAAIDSIARRTNRVKSGHRHNDIKEAILL